MTNSNLGQPRNGSAWWRVRDRDLGVAVIGSLIVLAVAVVLAGVAPLPPIAVLSLAAVPLFLWAAVKAPELVVGTIVLTQILETFEFHTPIGTLSPAIVALIVFLGRRPVQIVAMVTSPGYRLAAACLVAYVAGQAFQFLHGDAGAAAHHMISASSFAAYAVLGMYVGTRWSHLAAAGIGSATALLVLAGLALSANLGLVLVPAAQGPAREIFGVTSPFFRTYGINTDTIGLFLPLCVPWLALTIRSAGTLRVRATSIAVLAVIWLASFLLFQSRSMILEVPVALLLAWSLANRKFSTGAVLVGLYAAAVLITGLALAALTEVVSTQLRVESYAFAFDYLVRNPSVFFVGTSPEEFRVMVNAKTTYGDQIPPDAPIHDLLLETLITGGVVSALALVVLVVAPIVRIIRTARRVDRFSPPAALAFSAVVIAVLEASVTPSIANSGLLWVTLGIAVAVAASTSSMGKPDLVVGDSYAAWT